MAWAATAAAADMSIGDRPSEEEDCEDIGEDEDGRSIADVATAGLEIGGCNGQESVQPVRASKIGSPM